MTADSASLHRAFSADCFNRTWQLLEKPDRTAEDDEQMLLLAMASLWHWTQREDCTLRHRSIGYWQVSRVYAVLGQAENARRFAESCLRVSMQEPPFFLAYAHEAAARAAMISGDEERMLRHHNEAQALVPQVSDAEERSMLEKDLESLGPAK